jgi:hypothetical protein
MRQLYSAANAVMEIRVETPVPVPVPGGGHTDVLHRFTQTVAWNVIATISEPRARRAEEAVVSGRIPLQWTKKERTRPVKKEPT